MAEKNKHKYKMLDPSIEGQADLWKVSRLGFILNKIQERYPKLDLSSLMILMFLSHFTYADAEFIKSNYVTGKHKLYFVNILLNKLAKSNLIDKVQLTLDRDLKKIYPDNVFQLTTTGRNLVKKIHYYMDGTGNFLSFML